MAKYQEQLEAWRLRRQEALRESESGRTMQDIADDHGVTAAAVCDWIKKARKERAQERRAATLKAKQETVQA